MVRKPKSVKGKDLAAEFGGIDMSFFVSDELDPQHLDDDVVEFFDEELIGLFKGKPDSYTLLLEYGCDCKMVIRYKSDGGNIILDGYIAPCRKHRKEFTKEDPQVRVNKIRKG